MFKAVYYTCEYHFHASHFGQAYKHFNNVGPVMWTLKLIKKYCTIMRRELKKYFELDEDEIKKLLYLCIGSMGASVEAIVFNYNRHTRTYEDYVFTENNVL